MYHIDCYQCINVCPFNKKPGLGHDLVRWLVRRRSAWVDKALVSGDNLFYKPLYDTGMHAR